MTKSIEEKEDIMDRLKILQTRTPDKNVFLRTQSIIIKWKKLKNIYKHYKKFFYKRKCLRQSRSMTTFKRKDRNIVIQLQTYIINIEIWLLFNLSEDMNRKMGNRFSRTYVSMQQIGSKFIQSLNNW